MAEDWDEWLFAADLWTKRRRIERGMANGRDNGGQPVEKDREHGPGEFSEGNQPVDRGGDNEPDGA